MSISPLKSKYEYESLPPGGEGSYQNTTTDELLSLLGQGKRPWGKDASGNKSPAPASLLSPLALYRNFYAMSIAFALNHGCVTTCLAYSSTMLGNSMGAVSSGCLYVAYAFSAFVLAKPVVAMIGPKNGLLLGMVGYCIYVGGFLLAMIALREWSPLSWGFSIVGGIIGGLAGGLLWTSQGRYFARNATLYVGQGSGGGGAGGSSVGSKDDDLPYSPHTTGLSSLSTTRMPSSRAVLESYSYNRDAGPAPGGGGLLNTDTDRPPIEAVNSTFSAIFAAAFLGIETATKLLATFFFLLDPDTAAYVVFFLYTLGKRNPITHYIPSENPPTA